MTDDDSSTCCCLLAGLTATTAVVSYRYGKKKGKETRYSRQDFTDLETRASQEDKPWLIKQIEDYQKFVSPEVKKRLGKNKICKFTPSCSEYARQATQKYGSFEGAILAMRRLSRCNPFSKGGYDPVPE